MINFKRQQESREALIKNQFKYFEKTSKDIPRQLLAKAKGVKYIYSYRESHHLLQYLYLYCSSSSYLQQQPVNTVRISQPYLLINKLIQCGITSR